MAGVHDHTLLDRHSTLPQTFLRSPILTLTLSLNDSIGEDITTHDVLDAYTILAFRLRTICSSFTGNESNIPALQALEINSDLLSCRLQRDIRRALEDPFGSSTSQSTNEPLFNTMVPSAIQPHEDLICAASEASTLCQRAIQIVSLAFRFPLLYSLFSGKSHFFRWVYAP